MKTKITTRYKILLLLLCVLTFVGALFALTTMSIKPAYAATSTSAKYKTYGTYSEGDGYISGCPSNFTIYMHSSTQSGTGTIYNSKVLNWTYVYIKIEVSEITEHTSFKLTRNGSTYTSKTLSGNSNMTLYSGALPDGDYELTYVGDYKKNFLYKTRTYTYKYSFTIDKTGPVGTLKGGTTTLSSGAYTNQQITYSVTDYKPWVIYYKRPSGSTYYSTTSTSYSVAATESNNGWWYFYAEDYYYNTNSTVSVYLDTVAPVGTVKAGGVTVANGGYTNKAFAYTATDTGGVSYCQYKYPGGSSWLSYTAGTSLTGSYGYGWYTFRAVDKAGNISDEYKIYYDAGLPTGTVYGGTTSKSSGSYTNASYVKYVASDSYSGIANCYVRMPGSSSYTSYASGTQLATEGTYYFYSVDKSGNASATLSITLDKTKPTGTLYGGTSIIKSGDSTNASYIRFVPYDAIGLSATYVKKPGSSSYVSYASGTQLTDEGTYSFYSVDLAGNTSDTYTVTINRLIPSAQLYADDTKMPNGSYTNANYIRFECSSTSYVKLPGASVFTAYISGTEYYKPGKYVFYGVDSAGNNTGNYTIVIDRTSKPVTLSNVSKGNTSGDVTITWTDGDADTYAPIKSVTINGKPYAKNATIFTIDTGVYKVVSVDAAGNTWETEFTSSKQNVKTQTLQKEYFETYDANGNYFSFASYDSAFAFAFAREKSFVRQGTWNSSVWDAGMAMDAKDSVNAQNGTYFIYKRSGVESEEVAYFTEARLDEVIAEYARIGLNSFYYWEKEYATIADGENLFTFSDAKTILADYVELFDNITCFIDGNEFIGSIYNVEGNHLMVISDDWGNSCEYEITVVRSPASIFYAIGDGSNIEVIFDRTYRFSDAVTISIFDQFDKFAMFSVYDGSGKLLGNFSIDETFTLTKSGSYTVIAVNHFGYSQVAEFIVSRAAPATSIEEDEEAKRLEISITESVDDVSHIQLLEIYKSVDGGQTWILLDKDDYGTAIALGTYKYYFRTSGMYRIVIMDEFRTGIDAITESITYEQPNPDGTLVGVENGGFTNGEVSFVWTDEAIVTLERDGVLLEYKSGDKLTMDGNYTLTFENFDGFKTVYTFTIDTVKPEIQLDGVDVGAAVSGDVTVNFVEDNLIIEVFKDGVSIGSIQSGAVFTESGHYRVLATDLAGNWHEVNFTIDKFVDFSIDINEKGIANSVTATAAETVKTVLTKDGNVCDYTIGQTVDIPGVYVLTLTDELGNTASVSFSILEPRVGSFEYNFDDMPGFEKVLVNGQVTRLNYGTLELLTEGRYEVGVVVNGKTYSFTVMVDTTAPTIEISGVTNGGATNNPVILSNLSEEGRVKVFLGEKELDYVLGNALTAEGTYRVIAMDICGNITVYNFVIDTTAPEIIIEGVSGSNRTVRGDIRVLFTEDGLKTELLRNNISIGEVISGMVVTESGEYKVVATDAAGNKSEELFIIDKTVDFNINIYEKGIANSVTATANEPVSVFLVRGDEEIEYKLGDAITLPGEYMLTLTDDLGNTITVSFTIVQPLVNRFEHNFDETPSFEKVLIGGEEKRLNYGTLELFEDGTYEVGVVVSGTTYYFTVTVDGTAPTLTLSGVENGGKTKKEVVLSDLSEKAELHVFLNDEEIEYNLGDELKQAGNYRVVVIDACGNSTEYAFTIQYSLSAGIIALIVIGSLAVAAGIVVIILKKRKIF